MPFPETPLNEDITRPLAQTRPWMKFVAIMGFIGAGFALLAALMMLTFFQFIPVPMPQQPGFPEHGMFILMGLIYLFVASLYFVPSFLLFRYAASLNRIEQDGQADKLVKALEYQRQFWKYVGICIIAGICVWLLSMIAFVAISITTAASQLH